MQAKVQDPKKWQIKAKPTSHHFEGKFNWFKPRKKTQEKRKAQRKAHDLENQDVKLGFKLKDSFWFK
jgi:hypothetical protein